MLVERIGRNGHLNPLAATGDDGKHRGARLDHPHIVLKLGHERLVAAARLLGIAEWSDSQGAL
jgi:hypothetical protein